MCRCQMGSGGNLLQADTILSGIRGYQDSTSLRPCWPPIVTASTGSGGVWGLLSLTN